MGEMCKDGCDGRCQTCESAMQAVEAATESFILEPLDVCEGCADRGKDMSDPDAGCADCYLDEDGYPTEYKVVEEDIKEGR